MTIAHLLEDFGTTTGPGVLGRFMDEEALEDFRLSAFEQGYSAGWEDCIRAQQDERMKLSTNLSNSLEDLSFTYQEALNSLLISIEPIFEQMVGKILPDVMMQLKGHIILEQIMNMIKNTTDAPIQIAVPPGTSGAVHKVLSEPKGLQLSVIEDASLTAEQADIRIGDSAIEIDGAQLTAAFSESIEAFFHQVKEESIHG
ncbi:MAG: ABC transporter ATP-binding protein [Arenibacterium sp.]